MINQKYDVSADGLYRWHLSHDRRAFGWITPAANDLWPAENLTDLGMRDRMFRRRAVNGERVVPARCAGGLRMLGLTYFKRFRMEIDLARSIPAPTLPPCYRFLAWQPDLLEAHADAKYQSFRNGIDSNVFPCLGDADGCLRLMREISHKDGFLPQATWLVATDTVDGPREYCGTIQGIRDRSGLGAIQNLGTTPDHRGQGLGRALMLAALGGFRAAGLERAYLEVTAQNDNAIRLYRSIGFHKVRTVYKAVEGSSVAAR